MSYVQIPLFDLDDYDPADASTLAGRQAERILEGHHPLAYGGRTVELHRAAPKVTTDDGNASKPFRCGSCRFRQMIGEGNRRARCMFGVRTEPMPLALRLPGGPTERVIMPRVTGAAASVVLGWWPACTDYSPTGE
jgi:hypothetical protein